MYSEISQYGDGRKDWLSIQREEDSVYTLYTNCCQFANLYLYLQRSRRSMSPNTVLPAETALG